MRRDYLIDAFREYDENADFMTREQVGMMVDFTLDIFDKAGYDVVTKKRMRDLRFDSELLIALQNHGVDNWEGWSDALRSLEVDEG